MLSVLYFYQKHCLPTCTNPIEETEDAQLDYSVPCWGKPAGKMKVPHTEEEPLTAKYIDEKVEVVSTV